MGTAEKAERRGLYSVPKSTRSKIEDFFKREVSITKPHYFVL